MAKAGTYNSNAKMSEELETTEPIHHSLLFQILVLLLILVSSRKRRHGEYGGIIFPNNTLRYYVHFLTFYSIYSHIWSFPGSL